MNKQEELYYLIRAFLKNEYKIKDFCSNFERIYNLELDKKTLSNKESRVFKLLFDKVAYYSPIPEDRKNWPGFVDEDSIHKAITEAAKALDIQ